MSNIHVLVGDGRGKVSVVMHFAVPGTDNSASPGVNWQTALVNSGIGGNTSMPIGTGPAQITQAEADSIAAGELFEHRANFPLESAGTRAAGQRVALRAFYVREKAAVIADLQKRLKYTGHTESEA